MTAEEQKQITSLRMQGLSQAKIASKLNLNVNAVKSWCRRHPIDAESKSVCLYCGKPTQQKPNRKEKKFCSDKCRAAWWSEHPEKRAITDWGYNANRSNIKSVKIDSSVANYHGLTSTAYMFYNMQSANSIIGADSLLNRFGKLLFFEMLRHIDLEKIDRVPNLACAEHRKDSRQNHSGNSDDLESFPKS